MMTVSDRVEEGLGGQSSVSTLELFFDLVFVFVITQLTSSFSEALSASSPLRCRCRTPSMETVGSSAGPWRAS